MTSAATKIYMMRTSNRCLVSGLLGLVPVIGAPFAWASLWFSFRARRAERTFWNPAKPRRILGFFCGLAGALIWTIVDAIIINNLCELYINS
jgi:hypothetical protein